MTNGTLLELRNLNKYYENGFQAVKDVSFSIGYGQLVGLIGPNGCGKSTMMRCINKLHKISSGDILIGGESILRKSAKDLAQSIASVPAQLKSNFGLTVYETVMMGRYPFLKNIWWETDYDESMVMEAMEKFGVKHLQDRSLDMLSSGEMQRVLISKAYVQEPKIMLVDEPTSHLDMKYKLDVMEYLNAMVKSNMSILVAEHDISLMARYCDTCIIMKEGSIVKIGPPKEIITPELIEEVYGVSASVGFDKDGEIFILPKRYRSESGHGKL